MTEDELSADARAILTYARHWGEPFTRIEIVEVAPGAAWEPLSYFPRTVAKPDPIRELIRAGLIELAEERRSNGGKNGGHPYKVYRLTECVTSLEDLLDELTDAVREDSEWLGRAQHDIRAEIMERFGKP